MENKTYHSELHEQQQLAEKLHKEGVMLNAEVNALTPKKDISETLRYKISFAIYHFFFPRVERRDI